MCRKKTFIAEITRFSFSFLVLSGLLFLSDDMKGNVIH